MGTVIETVIGTLSVSNNDQVNEDDAFTGESTGCKWIQVRCSERHEEKVSLKTARQRKPLIFA